MLSQPTYPIAMQNLSLSMTTNTNSEIAIVKLELGQELACQGKQKIITLSQGMDQIVAAESTYSKKAGSEYSRQENTNFCSRSMLPRYFMKFRFGSKQITFINMFPHLNKE
jgi:hypothetical protein